MKMPQSLGFAFLIFLSSWSLKRQDCRGVHYGWIFMHSGVFNTSYLGVLHEVSPLLGFVLVILPGSWHSKRTYFTTFYPFGRNEDDDSLIVCQG